MHAHTLMQILITHIHTHIHTHTYTHTHIYIHACIHIHNTHTHIYIEPVVFCFKICLLPFLENAYSVSWTIFKAFSIFMLYFAGDG